MHLMRSPGLDETTGPEIMLLLTAMVLLWILPAGAFGTEFIRTPVELTTAWFFDQITPSYDGIVVSSTSHLGPCIRVSAEGEQTSLPNLGGADWRGMLTQSRDGVFYCSSRFVVHDGITYSLDSPFTQIYSMAPDLIEGVWVATSDGVYWIHGERWTLLDPGPVRSESQIAVSDSHIVWWQYDGDVPLGPSLIGVSAEDGRLRYLGIPEGTGALDAIVCAPDDSIWISYDSVMRHNPLTEEWEDHSDCIGPIGSYVFELSVGGDGAIWARGALGVSRYNGAEWEIFVFSDYLSPGVECWDIAFDYEGHMWALLTQSYYVEDPPETCYHTYVASIGPEKLKVFAIQLESPFGVEFEAATVDRGPDGRMWLKVGGPPYYGAAILSYYDGQLKTEYVSDASKGENIDAIMPGLDGQLWVATTEDKTGIYGLRRLENGKLRPVFDGEGTSVRFVKMLEDYDRDIWMLGSGIVLRWDGQELHDYGWHATTDIGLDLDGTLWGAAFSRRDDWRGIVHYDRFGQSDVCLGPEAGGAIIVDRNGLKWVTNENRGSQSGLFKWSRLFFFDDDPDQFEQAPLAPEEINYPGYLDRDDQLWFSSSSGVCRFDGERWSAFDLRGKAVSIAQDSDGNMWFVNSSDGLASILLAQESLVLCCSAGVLHGTQSVADEEDSLRLAVELAYNGPRAYAELYAAIQMPDRTLVYIAPQGAAPAFPIFYAAFDGSVEFLKPGPDYTGPGSMPNTPDMKDVAPPPLPLPDPPAGQGPTGLALFAYPVPYFANVPLPAYSAIEDFVLLNTTLPENAPTGTYTFHVGITAPSSISNVYRTASTPFEVSPD